MLELLRHPSQVYDLFQALGLVTFCAILWIGLRRFLSSLKILFLLLSSVALIKPMAAAFAQLAGQSEGQSYYGALAAQIGGVVVFLQLLRAPQELRIRVWYFFALASSALYALLRLGCFFRGCCWGRLCAFPWAHYYKNSEVVTPWLHLPLHPVQIYSVIHGVLLLLILWRFGKKYPLEIFLVLMGTGRILTDFFRADIDFHKLSWLGFSPNTFYSLLCLLAGLILWARQRKSA